MQVVDISTPIGVDISTHLAVNYPGLNYLIDARINQETGLAYDAKDNMNPVINQVPVFISDGTEKLTFDDLSGVTIVSSSGTSTPSINGNDIEFTAGTCYNLLLSNGERLGLQEFTGDKSYSDSGNFNATISGTGSRWTRIDGIPDFLQAKGFKLVSLDSGVNEAYIPLNISDATLTADLTAVGHTVDSITELTQDGKSFLNDGSELDSHPTTSDLFIGGDGNVIGDGSSAWINTGFIPTEETEIEWKGKYNRVDLAYQRMGANFTVGQRFYFGIQTDDFGFFFGDGAASYSNAADTEIHVYKANKTGIYIDGVLVAPLTYTSFTQGSIPISILATQTSLGSYFYNCDVEMEYFIIRDNGVEVRNYQFNGNTLDSVNNVEADSNNIKYYPTISDYLDSVEAANPGLDLNAVIAGETILPTENFKYTLESGKFTKGIKLLKP